MGRAMSETPMDGSQPSVTSRVAREIARETLAAGIQVGYVDRLLLGASSVVVISGAVAIGVAALVVTAIPLAVVTAIAAPTGTLAVVLGLGWFAAFVAVAGLGIRLFVRMIGRRVIGITERLGTTAATVAELAPEAPPLPTTSGERMPTLSELDARLASPATRDRGAEQDRS